MASALPLRTMSRLWGAFNSLTIPEALRPAGFKLYSWIFGCNLDEMKNPDLYAYKNLSEFFYRELKDGVRPIADSPLVNMNETPWMSIFADNWMKKGISFGWQSASFWCSA